MERAAERVRRTIREHKLIQRGDHIVMGLSGGPDSVCLYHVLLGLSRELELTLHPVHINHMFRPGDAERDQKYVEELCEKCGTPAVSVTVDCGRMARELSMTSEEAGRKARYDAFFEVAGRIREHQGNQVRIAVAHNAEDQAETVLFRILRGTGTDGLAGMAYEREERRGSRTFPVIRPLLDTSRKDIEGYCKAMELEPVTDHTNNEPLYARNRLRLELIPYLEREYNSNIKDCLTRLGGIAAEDKDYFWNETLRVMETLRVNEGSLEEIQSSGRVVLDREGLAACHPAIRHRIIMKAFGETGLTRDITAERLGAADEIILKKQGPKVVEFPHGFRITVKKGKVLFEGGTL
ncbi:MAG: tRNA lysidine(34) synthetase TilS [Lentihominibacter sp.]